MRGRDRRSERHKEGAVSQGTQAAPRGWTRRGRGVCPEAPGRSQPCRNLILDIGVLELRGSRFALF